jgi:hypothetical protein
MPELKHVLIVGDGMNELDASGEVLLSRLVTRLREKDLDISFTGLNDHVLDVMSRTHLLEKVGVDHFYPSVAHAVEEIHAGVCIGEPDHECPLIHTTFKGLEIEPELRKRLEKADERAQRKN